MEFYRGYGLIFCSSLPLPELQEAPAGTVDVTIRLGKIHQPEAVTMGTKTYFQISGEAIYLFWDQVGAFRVRSGKEIVIEPDPDVEVQLLRLPLLGPVMFALLHQRRHLVLHASAVCLNGGAVAFLGRKGWGKSTLAATLYARGHSLIADDVVAFKDVCSTKEPMLLPGVPRLKLWPDTATAIGDDPETLPRIWSRVEKRGLAATYRFLHEPVPLKHIYVLSNGPTAALERLKPQEAMLLLLFHRYAALFDKEWYQSNLVPDFKQCGVVVRKVPIYRLSRPKSHDLLPEIAKMVEENS